MMMSERKLFGERMQQAILQACSKETPYTNSLHVMGVICIVADSNDELEVVVKLHRTIYKELPPEQRSTAPHLNSGSAKQDTLCPKPLDKADKISITKQLPTHETMQPNSQLGTLKSPISMLPNDKQQNRLSPQQMTSRPQPCLEVVPLQMAQNRAVKLASDQVNLVCQSKSASKVNQRKTQTMRPLLPRPSNPSVTPRYYVVPAANSRQRHPPTEKCVFVPPYRAPQQPQQECDAQKQLRIQQKPHASNASSLPQVLSERVRSVSADMLLDSPATVPLNHALSRSHEDGLDNNQCEFVSPLPCSSLNVDNKENSGLSKRRRSSVRSSGSSSSSGEAHAAKHVRLELPAARNLTYTAEERVQLEQGAFARAMQRLGRPQHTTTTTTTPYNQSSRLLSNGCFVVPAPRNLKHKHRHRSNSNKEMASSANKGGKLQDVNKSGMHLGKVTRFDMHMPKSSHNKKTAPVGSTLCKTVAEVHRQFPYKIQMGGSLERNMQKTCKNSVISSPALVGFNDTMSASTKTVVDAVQKTHMVPEGGGPETYDASNLGRRNLPDATGNCVHPPLASSNGSSIQVYSNDSSNHSSDTYTAECGQVQRQIDDCRPANYSHIFLVEGTSSNERNISPLSNTSQYTSGATRVNSSCSNSGQVANSNNTSSVVNDCDDISSTKVSTSCYNKQSPVHSSTVDVSPSMRALEICSKASICVEFSGNDCDKSSVTSKPLNIEDTVTAAVGDSANVCPSTNSDYECSIDLCNDSNSSALVKPVVSICADPEMKSCSKDSATANDKTVANSKNGCSIYSDITFNASVKGLPNHSINEPYNSVTMHKAFVNLAEENLYSDTPNITKSASKDLDHSSVVSDEYCVAAVVGSNNIGTFNDNSGIAENSTGCCVTDSNQASPSLSTNALCAATNKDGVVISDTSENAKRIIGNVQGGSALPLFNEQCDTVREKNAQSTTERQTASHNTKKANCTENRGPQYELSPKTTTSNLSSGVKSSSPSTSSSSTCDIQRKNNVQVNHTTSKTIDTDLATDCVVMDIASKSLVTKSCQLTANCSETNMQVQRRNCNSVLNGMQAVESAGLRDLNTTNARIIGAIYALREDAWSNIDILEHKPLLTSDCKAAPVLVSTTDDSNNSTSMITVNGEFVKVETDVVTKCEQSSFCDYSCPCHARDVKPKIEPVDELANYTGALGCSVSSTSKQLDCNITNETAESDGRLDKTADSVVKDSTRVNILSTVDSHGSAFTRVASTRGLQGTATPPRLVRYAPQPATRGAVSPLDAVKPHSVMHTSPLDKGLLESKVTRRKQSRKDAANCERAIKGSSVGWSRLLKRPLIAVKTPKRSRPGTRSTRNDNVAGKKC